MLTLSVFMKFGLVIKDALISLGNDVIFSLNLSSSQLDNSSLPTNSVS